MARGAIIVESPALYNRVVRESTGKLSLEEANRRLLENVEAWKRFEGESDAARWRNATDAERSAEGAALSRDAEQILKATGRRYVPQPFNFPRVDRIERKA